MKTDVQKHLLGIYSVFKARVNLIHSSIGHSATQGAETENEVRNLLADFLPSSYGLGSGIIIDTDGNSTKQIDIVIFDRSRSDYTLSTNSKIFLADHVIAAIEIKTTYTTGKKSSLESALENISSVKKLKVAPHTWIEREFNSSRNQFEFSKYTPAPPLGIVFFFRGQETQRALDLDIFLSNLKAAIEQIPVELQPDLLLSLDHATFVRHPDIGKRNISAEYSVNLIQLDTDTTKVLNIEGATEQTKAIIDFANMNFSDGQTIQAKQIENDRSTSQMLILTGKSWGLDPVIYRVAKINSKFYLLDKFRAFLNFVWAIEKIVAMKHTSKAWSPVDYFGSTFPLSSRYPQDFEE